MHGTLLDGRYRLDRRLGAGGMGEVWRATDTRLGREVAVKTISTQVAEDPRLEARFRKEARTAAGLAHPHIVTVHDHGEGTVGGRRTLYLVMELVRGRSLAAVLAKGPQSVPDVVDWAVRICQALAAAHAAGVVHRDVKPANIMVHGPGETEVKICDFGIARLAEETGTGLTATGMGIGTPAYMSPEQVRGERGIDGRSDLYSLGCVLYELLAGTPPFTGAAWSVVHQHVNTAPRPLRELRPELPRELSALVMELLAKEPARRPADAAATAERLRRVLAPGTAERPAPTRPTNPHDGSAPARPEPRPEPRPAPAADPARPRDPAPAGPLAPGAGGVVAWGALLGAGGVFAQSTLVAGWSAVGAGLAAALAFGLVSLTAREDAPRFRPPAKAPEGPTVGMMFAVTLATAVFLGFWPPAPWWTVPITAVGLLFVLVVLAIPVASLGRVAGRGTWQGELAMQIGALNAALLAGLLAWNGTGVWIALGWAAGLWIAATFVTGLLLPRVRAVAGGS
ncbi:serine/threonine-protein kinase [Streptomyces sp. BI20]|uniref:serine/threonine-protein kinase n=1 Tax=Streptomyces sp. BI20 TaxID=3403460 RepID=UPI003C75BAF7